MAAVVCGHCGTSNAAGRQFCENCDGFLDWDGTAEPDPAPAASRPPVRQQPPPPQQSRPAPPRPPQQAAPPQAAPPQAAPQYGPPQYGPPPSAPAQPPRQASPYAAPAHPGTLTYSPVGMPPSTGMMLRRCSNCGETSDSSRRFCRRCGTWLVTPTLVRPGPPDRLGTRLRRRWWGGTTGAYRGDLTRGTIAFRIASVIGVILLIGVVLTVAGFHPIRRVTDLVGHVLGSGRVSGVTAQAVPGDALPGHPAAWAVDDVRGRGFATRWTSGSSGDPNSACSGTAATPATASSLNLTFPRATNVREIGIEAGLPAGDPDIANRWRPQTLELHWPGGKCQAVQLAKDPGLQRFAVDQGIVGQVAIVVVAGYPPDGPGSDRLDIGEITFWQR